MEIIKVKDSARKKKRDLRNALGDDILRYVAELVTNSDDSYRRIESRGELYTGEKIIYIELLKDKKKYADSDENYMIRITDNAEGMTKTSLIKIFEEYGGNNAGGIELRARGIFGQGASDVLRSSAIENRPAQIETIKDNKVTKLRYNMDENLDPNISVEEVVLSNSKLAEYRKNLMIPQNGTRITFGIPSTVKFKKKTRENLAHLIETLPSFRYLLADSNRKIIYRCGDEQHVLNSEKYLFDNSNLISNVNFDFTFDNKKVKCELKTYKNTNKSENKTDIIVRDNNYTVFDNTMFHYENSPAASSISGELIIEELYNICYEHLNSENPDSILRDNRTGFDEKNAFYVALKKAISPYIEDVLSKSDNKVRETNLTNNKKFSNALKELNKYFKAELEDSISGGTLGGIVAPPEGFRFARQTIDLTKGKTYNLKLYINSSLISSADVISINCEDNPYLEVSPYSISYMDSESDGDLVVKNVSIKTKELTNEPITLEASCGDRKTICLINVINQDIHYPANGLEFFPNDISLVYNKRHKMDLYFDATIVPIGSIIKFSSESVNLLASQIEINQMHMISDTIGVIHCFSDGGNVDDICLIEAAVNDISTFGKMTLIEESKNDNSGDGLIAGFKLEPNSKMFYQAYFDTNSHFIKVNNANPINIRIMGEMKDLDEENPNFSKNQYIYLCDIIANEAATILVKKKHVEKGEVNFEDFEDAVQQTQQLIQQHKNQIYVKMYKALVENSN